MKQPDKKSRLSSMAVVGIGLGLISGILLKDLPLSLLVGAALVGFGNMTTKRWTGGYEKMDTYF